MGDAERSAWTLLWIGTGLIVWALHFLVLYGTTALVCARRLDAAGGPGAAIVAWTAALATIACIAVVARVGFAAWRGRRRDRLAPWLTATLCAMAAFAMLLEAIPVLIVPTCG